MQFLPNSSLFFIISDCVKKTFIIHSLEDSRVGVLFSETFFRPVLSLYGWILLQTTSDETKTYVCCSFGCQVELSFLRLEKILYVHYTLHPFHCIQRRAFDLSPNQFSIQMRKIAKIHGFVDYVQRNVSEVGHVYIFQRYFPLLYSNEVAYIIAPSNS